MYKGQIMSSFLCARWELFQIYHDEMMMMSALWILV